MPETMVLPNGEATASEERYVTAWRAFADRVADLLGGHRHSYDPGLTLYVGAERVELTQKAAARLHAVALALECAERLGAALRGALGAVESPAHDPSSADAQDDALEEARDALAAWDRVRASLGRA